MERINHVGASQPHVRLDESSRVFYPFPPLFVASRPLLLPRPAAQETTSKFHPIRPSRPPFTLSFPLSFDFWAMMINASHRAVTVRPSHAVLLIPSLVTNNFSYNSDGAAQRRCMSLLIPDIAVTHLDLLVGTISVYKPALLLAGEGIAFNSKCVSISLFSFSV